MALRLNGTNEFYTAGDTSTYKFLHGALDQINFKLSISFLFELDNANPNTIYTFFSNVQGSSANTGIQFFYDDRGSSGRSRQLVFSIYRGVPAAAVIAYTSGVNIMPNNTLRHHFAITYDQSLASNNLLIYLDAALLAGGSKSGSLPSLSNSTDIFHVGSFGNGILPLGGVLDEFTIYESRVLTPGDISQLYLPRLKYMPRQVQPNDINSYWPLDDGPIGSSANGVTAKDYSGGNDGTVVGGVFVAGQLSYPGGVVHVSGGVVSSPSDSPSVSPSVSPSESPSGSPSESPSNSPSQSPSQSPSISPSVSPSASPSASSSPSFSPSVSPSASPSASPSTEIGDLFNDKLKNITDYGQIKNVTDYGLIDNQTDYGQIKVVG